MSFSYSTLKTRVEKASEILTVKNLDPDCIKTSLEKTLEQMGIDDDAMGLKILEADTIAYEDFDQEFSKQANFQTKDSKLTVPVSSSPIPVARMKIAWEILKGKDPFVKGINKDLSQKQIGQWSDLELLQQYGKDCPLDVQEQLTKRTNGRHSIIFNDDGSVDAENSLFLVRRARHQETRDTFLVNDTIKQVYRVGEFPMDVMFECPVHVGTLLAGDYCGDCGKKWDTNDHERNVFIRLITEEEDDIDMRIYRNKSFEELKADFPKVFIHFNELKEEDRLPSLKRKVSKPKDSDPFRVVSSHRTY